MAVGTTTGRFDPTSPPWDALAPVKGSHEGITAVKGEQLGLRVDFVTLSGRAFASEAVSVPDTKVELGLGLRSDGHDEESANVA